MPKNFYKLPDPDPAVLAQEIVESLETALDQFRGIEDELKEDK